MYRCQSCSCVASPGTPQHRVVTATRVRHYPFRRDAHSAWKFKDGKWKWVQIDDPGGTGVEIVSELTVCTACALRLRHVPQLDIVAGVA